MFNRSSAGENSRWTCETYRSAFPHQKDEQGNPLYPTGAPPAQADWRPPAIYRLDTRNNRLVQATSDDPRFADLIRRSGYKNCFVFKYSPRPGTLAAKKFEDDVPLEVKKRRNIELLAVQEQVGLAHHRAWIGQTVEVLTEGPSVRAEKQGRKLPAGWTQLVGRTRSDHIVVFDAPEALAGQYVDVTITDATSLTLFGRGCFEQLQTTEKARRARRPAHRG